MADIRIAADPRRRGLRFHAGQVRRQGQDRPGIDTGLLRGIVYLLNGAAVLTLFPFEAL